MLITSTDSTEQVTYPILYEPLLELKVYPEKYLHEKGVTC